MRMENSEEAAYRSAFILMKVIRPKRGSKEDEIITEIRRERKKAIENFDFECAEKCDQMIAKTLQTSHTNELCDVFVRMACEVESYLDRHKESAIEIEKERRKLEKAKRKEIDEEFKQLQIRQMGSLGRLEAEKNQKKRRTLLLPNPKQEGSLLHSRKAGLAGRFKEAEELRDSSASIGQMEIGNRIQIIDSDYSKSRDTLLKKFSVSLSCLSEKLQASLECIEAEYSKKAKREEAKMDSSLIVIFQKYSKLSFVIKNDAERMAFVESLRQSYIQILSERNVPIPPALLGGPAFEPEESSHRVSV